MNSDENMVMQNTSFDMKGYIHALYDLELALQKESLRIKGLMDIYKVVQSRCNAQISEINDQYDHMTTQAAVKAAERAKGFKVLIAILSTVFCFALSVGLFMLLYDRIVEQLGITVAPLPVIIGAILLWFVIPLVTTKIASDIQFKKSVNRSILVVAEEKNIKIQEIAGFRDELLEKIQDNKFECVRIKEALRAKLDAMYSNDVILPQYRSYEAIDCFKDYFDAEMGTSLTGPDGAYKFFEGRRNAGMIVRRFEEITDKLSANMNEAYRSLSASIDNMHSDISKSINKLDSSVAMARLEAERASHAADLAVFNSFLNLL